MLRKIAFSLLSLVVMMSCNRPERIPEDKLQSIIKEIFLTNAYAGMNYQYSSDSVSYYAPILEKHGYTIEDFKFTMYKLSLLKSSRISEIFDLVIADLDMEYSTLEYRRRRLDSVDMLIRNHYRDTIYIRDTTLKINDLSQISKADFKVNLKPGEYLLTYNYMVDSTDQNQGYRMYYNLLDEKDSTISSSQRYYNRAPKSAMSIDFNVISPKIKKLQVKFVETISKERKKPSLIIDSIKVTFTPALSESRERIVDENLKNSLKQLLKDVKNQKDSIAIDTIPPYTTYKMRHTELRRVGTPDEDRAGTKH